MIIRAEAKYIRVSHKKLRQIINLIRNKSVTEALDILRFLNIANKRYVVKLLESLQANSRIKDPDVKPETLFIKKIVVNEGPKLRRLWPRARGRADVIARRISHVEVEAEMPEPEKKKK